MAPDRASPLQHPIRVETIRPRGTEIVIRAEEGQLPAVAKLLGVVRVESLEARYTLSRNGERVALEGRIVVGLHQACVVTLDPFPVRLDVPVKLDFAPGEDALARRSERDDAPIDIEVLLNEDDPPEPITGGVIDLGAITLEFLALALDPYPRKPGAQFQSAAGEAGAESPFAALAKLKRGD
ncbi:DUF177 domain-containing protein [Bosea sp. (in: a-proteobacteria)]|uniref:YceD family protein n=1 Tax=Bosea sp. (in: a-proteobacteria) TaxID=1871050 RepID=UPI002630AA33|nr:DUF177 domain-containing protein [Bosea sp. (in: a-proteobacteria)]MCO5092853.1 DUF177 domain-containing protein [Bosea sp. (in: a-proteobacteria)]